MKLKLLAFIFAFTVTGCASISDPVIWQTTQLNEPKLAPKKILVLMDFSIEYPLIRSGLAVTKEQNIERSYGVIAKSIVKNIQDQGIDADYKLHYSPIPFTIPNAGYSHILIESITKLTQVSSQYGTFARDRVWRGVLLENDGDSNAKPKILTNEVYTSDGADCFYPVMYANSTECRNKYLDALLKQLVPIGIKKVPEVTAK